MKLRFDTFKAETLPTVEFFKSKGRCVEVDTSQDRQAVWALVGQNLAEYTDRNASRQTAHRKSRDAARPETLLVGRTG